MATPENSTSTTLLLAELAEVQRKLEKTEENENTIERFFKQEKLLELQDELQDEIDTLASRSKSP